MNSKERVLAALNGEKPDRTPVVQISALTTVELQDATGCFMPDVHSDAEALAKLCYANHEVLGLDGVTFIINYFGEPAACGCELQWGNQSEYPVFVSHPWVNPEDAKVPDDLLDQPSVATYLKALKYAKTNYGDRVAVFGKVMGPLSMVQVMCGVENVMYALVDDPAKVKHFLKVASNILVKCANAQFELGVDAISLGEGGAGANMLSPKMYQDVLFDVHRDLLRRLDGRVIMHICGDITSRLDGLKNVGLDFFHFDWAIEPKVMKTASDGKFGLIGNVNTADLMMASPEDIEKQVIANLEAGIDMIAPGCAVSPKCPNANLAAMADAVKKWFGNS